MLLTDDIKKIKGVNSKIIKPLERLNLKTVGDLIFYLPKKYEDFSITTQIKNIRIGKTYTISGTVSDIKNVKSFYSRLTITEAIIKDKSGFIKAIWYNQPFIVNNIPLNSNINLSGKIYYQKNHLIMQNPSYEIIKPNYTPIHTGKIIPIYKETKGITSRWLRFLIKNALSVSDKIEDALPKYIIEKRNLLNINEAINKVHFPKNKKEKDQAKKRFSYEELLYIQLIIINSKNSLKKKGSPKIKPAIDFTKNVLNSLPFSLTDAQKKVLWQIMKDMQNETPTNRLVEGDVGCGKTLVALLAGANTAKNNWQTAFMAPTEILATQHFYEAVKILKKSNLNIALLTASESKAFEPELEEIYSPKKSDLIQKINSGNIDIVIGTHSLIQDKIKFKKLGLVILDEQHRFGVNQRAKLTKDNKITPHFISMTATPIPRTLAMSLYGDLDISIIDQMPKNRKKIITKSVLENKRKDAYLFIENEIKKGRQAFVICPKIENKNKKEDEIELSETQIKTKQIKAVKEEYEKLKNIIFPKLKIEMLHGKLKPKEKERIMNDFKEGKFDILVSTSVVEVGVDIPNASIMMIEGADRFGLAQLHQFRGRVGRGKHQSYCFLFSDTSSPEARERLKIMEYSSDGFTLAEYDLKMRGPGDFIGKNQSGIPDIAMEALLHPKLIAEAQDDAKEILEKDPSLKKHPKILKKVSKMLTDIHFE